MGPDPLRRRLVAYQGISQAPLEVKKDRPVLGGFLIFGNRADKANPSLCYGGIKG